MKSFFRILISSVIICSSVLEASAQLNLGIYSGYGRSEFKLQNEPMSGVPLGFTASFCILQKFEAGIEYCTLIKPFEGKEVYTLDYYGSPVEVEGPTYQITQNNIGIFARYYVKLDDFCPYIKAGIAYYTGKREFIDAQIGLEPQIQFKGTYGYYPSMGVKTSFGLYLEFMYHVVNRQLDYEGSDTYKYNNYMIVLGYRHSIKL